MTDHPAGQRPAQRPPAPSGAEQRWQPIDTSAYIRRLERAQALLAQAAALAAATEAARMAPLVELQHRLAEDGDGHTHRRSHR